MTEQKHKPTLSIDFDGVIHTYEKGWQGGDIYGTLTPGFLPWAEKAKRIFTLTVYSSRSETAEGRTAMMNWLFTQMRVAYDAEYPAPSLWPVTPNDFEFTATKPKAFLTIDDRGVTFLGDWAALDPEKLLLFRTWYQQ